MPKGRLPDPLKRREILYGKGTPTEVLIEYGKLYLEEGRLNDAVEFFGVAGFKEGLMEMKELAIKEGDYFLLERVFEFLGEEGGKEEWLSLGKRALELEKFVFAKKAFAKAGDLEAMKEVEKLQREVKGGKGEQRRTEEDAPLP